AHDIGDIRLAAHIGGDAVHAVADRGIERIDRRLEPRRIASGGDHAHAPGRERGDRRETHAEARARNDGNLPGTIVHPFTAPSLRPRTRSFCAKVKTMTAGRLITTEAAINSPQRMPFSSMKKASAIESGR